MKIHDVTVPLRSDMPAYAGHPGPELLALKRLARGESSNTSGLTLGVHSGTHVDAPCHFLEGADSVEKLPLEALLGPCQVIDCGEATAIGRRELESRIDGSLTRERILLKTRNSALWNDPQFHPDYTYVDAEGSAWLVEQGVKLIGIDYLSIEQFGSPTRQVHETLLGAGIVILEGVDLSRISPGGYSLVCAPLKLVGSDGAPARVFLIEDGA
ncbi:MAG TPA: cyclase family protein [Dehalococcoidia bacterium]|nr:cyclase family protein [Dehalococcoidia bacterium]